MLPTREQVLDRFGDLYAARQINRAKVDRPLEALSEQIRGWFVDSPPDQEFTLKGTRYTVIVAAKANERKITNLRKLARTIKDAFWKVATVPLAAVDRLTDPEERKTFLSEALTGSRTVKAVANPPEAK